MNKIVVSLAIVLSCHLLNGQTKNFIDQPYLETTAKADSLVKPDIIYLDILLKETDNRNRISVEALEDEMASALKSLGIDLKTQLTLSDLGSNFKNYFLKQKEVLKSKAYKLKVFDAQTAGKVLVVLENIGISNVSLDKTAYSKIEALKLVLKSKAVRKAKTQADYLVQPLNQKIGGALFILDKYYQRYDFEEDLQEVVMVGYSSGNKAEHTPAAIEFKPIKVEAEVTIRFRIE